MTLLTTQTRINVVQNVCLHTRLLPTGNYMYMYIVRHSTLSTREGITQRTQTLFSLAHTTQMSTFGDYVYAQTFIMPQ